MSEANSSAPSTAFGRSLLPLWTLDPAVTFLNHGSFGATPRVVLEEQNEWRARMERQPVRFMTRELPLALRAAAELLAAYLGTRGECIGFVDNATTAVNAVLRWIDWRKGDEVLVCRHVYLGVRNAVYALGERFGVRLRVAMFDVPLAGDEAVIAAFEAALGPATRLVIVDHISSPLAAVMPVASIVDLCRRRGVPVLVDGAHAPGMLDLNLDALGADWYTGNCHKWLYAPKGCGFLWSAPHRVSVTHPGVISVDWGQGYAREFDWAGTRDPSAWLSVPAAIRFFEQFGATAARRYMRETAQGAAVHLAAACGAELLAPLPMFAAMAALRLPHSGPASTADALRLHDTLVDRYGIEVPLQVIDDALTLRISAQVYNEPNDFARLAEALCATA